jgi:hypothetical protein
MIVGFVGFIAALATFSVLRIIYRRVYHFRNRTEHDVTPFLLRIDLGELSELVDAFTEERLRYDLGPEEFRKEQLTRLRLLQEYMRWMSRNADILQEWGEYGFERRRYADEDGIRSCSLELIKSCRDFATEHGPSSCNCTCGLSGCGSFPRVRCPCSPARGRSITPLTCYLPTRPSALPRSI